MIDTETRAAMVQMYLSEPRMTHEKVAEHFGVSKGFAGKVIRMELQSGSGVKPDRRSKKIEPPDDDVLDQIHEDKMDKHPRTSDWMDHVKPLNAHKRELELAVEHKQAELDAAKQELRDFTATLRQLMKEEV
jgi:transposase-like protein